MASTKGIEHTSKQEHKESIFHEVLTRIKVYTRNDGTKTLIIDVYVDDLIVTGTSVEGIKVFKQ